MDAWLRAEAESRDADADRLFSAIFSAHVPSLAAPPSIVDRVMAALASQHGLRAAFPMPVWARAATVALLALGGLAAAGFWSTWVFDLLHDAWPLGPRAGRVFAALAGSLLQAFATTASRSASIGHALGLVFGSGPGAALLAANLFLALAASAALKHILTLEEKRP